MIGILDIGMGNLRSVASAVEEMGFDPLPIQKVESLVECTHLIIPGVGMFRTASDRLHSGEFAQAIQAFIAAGRPVMGICLGMQILATTGEEGGESQGLNLIPGRVTRLPVSLRLPHMGWNSVHVEKTHPILTGIKPDRDFYFVHSFFHQPSNPSHLIGTTTYGVPFASVIAAGSVVGCQFHPEKSQANGLKIIENFCRWNGQC